MSFISDYENLYKVIIRPPRQSYHEQDLGIPNEFYDQYQSKRHDFTLENSRHLNLKCSFYEPIKIGDKSNEQRQFPCIVYAHCNSGSRIEGMQNISSIISQGFGYFTFDFSGSGLSEGEYVTLGHNEWEDLQVVIKYLKNSQKVSKIGLWGRSMGAVTSLLYAWREPKFVSALVIDSAFSNLKGLALELAQSMVSLVPNFILEYILGSVRDKVKSLTNLDINDLDLRLKVKEIDIPVLFVCSKQDTYVGHHHTEKLYQNYKGQKQILVVQGEHNIQRDNHFKQQVMQFFIKNLVQKPYTTAPSGISLVKSPTGTNLLQKLNLHDSGFLQNQAEITNSLQSTKDTSLINTAKGSKEIEIPIKDPPHDSMKAHPGTKPDKHHPQVAQPKRLRINEGDKKRSNLDLYQLKESSFNRSYDKPTIPLSSTTPSQTTQQAETHQIPLQKENQNIETVNSPHSPVRDERMPQQTHNLISQTHKGALKFNNSQPKKLGTDHFHSAVVQNYSIDLTNQIQDKQSQQRKQTFDDYIESYEQKPQKSELFLSDSYQRGYFNTQVVEKPRDPEPQGMNMLHQKSTDNLNLHRVFPDQITNLRQSVEETKTPSHILQQHHKPASQHQQIIDIRPVNLLHAPIEQQPVQHHSYSAGNSGNYQFMHQRDSYNYLRDSGSPYNNNPGLSTSTNGNNLSTQNLSGPRSSVNMLQQVSGSVQQAQKQQQYLPQPIEYIIECEIPQPQKQAHQPLSSSQQQQQQQQPQQQQSQQQFYGNRQNSPSSQQYAANNFYYQEDRSPASYVNYHLYMQKDSAAGSFIDQISETQQPYQGSFVQRNPEPRENVNYYFQNSSGTSRGATVIHNKNTTSNRQPYQTYQILNSQQDQDSQFNSLLSQNRGSVMDFSEQPKMPQQQHGSPSSSHHPHSQPVKTIQISLNDINKRSTKLSQQKSENTLTRAKRENNPNSQLNPQNFASVQNSATYQPIYPKPSSDRIQNMGKIGAVGQRGEPKFEKVPQSQSSRREAQNYQKPGIGVNGHVIASLTANYKKVPKKPTNNIISALNKNDKSINLNNSVEKIFDIAPQMFKSDGNHYPIGEWMASQ